AWMKRLPAEDVRTFIGGLTRDGDSWTSRVVVYRVGDTPPEVIEVDARDGHGRHFVLVWRAQSGEERKEFLVRTDSPVVALRLDPRRRVAQTPEAPSDSPDRGDTVPDRLQILLTYVSATYSFPDRLVFGEARFVLRERTRLDRRLSFGAGFLRSRLGAFG